MARCTDKTGKTGLGHLPAEIYKFPQSGSTSHTDEEQGAQPANLSATEQRLYDELLALARKLDKRGAPGVYALVAAVADQVTLLKRKDQDTVAMLARGLDGLRQIDANHTRVTGPKNAATLPVPRLCTAKRTSKMATAIHTT